MIKKFPKVGSDITYKLTNYILGMPILSMFLFYAGFNYLIWCIFWLFLYASDSNDIALETLDHSTTNKPIVCDQGIKKQNMTKIAWICTKHLKKVDFSNNLRETFKNDLQKTYGISRPTPPQSGMLNLLFHLVKRPKIL